MTSAHRRVIGAHRIAFIPETAKKAGVRSRKRDADSDVRKNVRSNGECWVAKWIFRFAHLQQKPS
jgi:hypothetical protein